MGGILGPEPALSLLTPGPLRPREFSWRFILRCCFLFTCGILRSEIAVKVPSYSPPRTAPGTYRDKTVDPCTLPRPARNKVAIMLQSLREVSSKWCRGLQGESSPLSLKSPASRSESQLWGGAECGPRNPLWSGPCGCSGSHRVPWLLFLLPAYAQSCSLRLSILSWGLVTLLQEVLLAQGPAASGSPHPLYSSWPPPPPE